MKIYYILARTACTVALRSYNQIYRSKGSKNTFSEGNSFLFPTRKAEYSYDQRRKIDRCQVGGFSSVIRISFYFFFHLEQSIFCQKQVIKKETEELSADLSKFGTAYNGLFQTTKKNIRQNLLFMILKKLSLKLFYLANHYETFLLVTVFHL